MMSRVPRRIASVGVALVAALVSIHHCSFADSICLRLATQAFARLVSRALMKFGTAMASKMPIISTTIMISTRVNPRRARFTSLHIIDFVPPCVRRQQST